MLNTKEILCGIFLTVLFGFSAVTSYDILFQQAKMSLTVPLVDSQRQVMDKNPIIKLRVLDMTSTSNSTVTFKLEESQEFLQLDKLTGQLWFKQGSWNKDSTAYYNLVITAELSDGDTARMTLDLHVLPLSQIIDFCEQFLCFYESITYHVIEDFYDNFKPHEIGEISPKIYGRLCKMFDVNYQLLNASEFVSIKNNKLFTSAPLNHEMMSPGPDLKVAVQCSIKNDIITHHSTKVFNITIIDRNDNLIRVQDKVTNLTLNSPYFVKETLLNPHSFIVFKDDDTSLANANVEFHLLNDDAHIFKEACTKLQSNHTSMESTVFYCNLKFIISGHFTSSPYCVVLQAREIIRGKPMSENATVCIFTNLTSATRGVEFLPEPAKLRASEDRGRKMKKITSNPAASAELKVSGTLKADVEYRDTAEVLQNASDYARILEPLEPITDSKLSFKLIKDPLNIFNVTRLGGIVYVQNSTLLEKTLPASYNIELGWNSHVKSIKITIVGANNTCELPMNFTSFCSKHEFQEDCENACSFGSTNGRCKWRPLNAPSPMAHVSSVYATCTPDIPSCSDRKCDPLEKLGRRLNPQIHLCPQDCTTEIVHGILHNQKQGIGMVPREFVCFCDLNEQCSCGKPSRIETTTVLPTEFLLDFHNSSSGEFIMTQSMSTMRSNRSDCGSVCMMITIGSPTFLVIIIICLITMRRRYVKKMKKRMMNGPMVHYRGSNDTEIIHINIMNEIQKENYRQTYQKFDFDAKWEFDRNKLIVDTTLGEGEFGKVMKAYASDLNENDSITTVAVKTVKSSNNSVELLALLSEFQLLQEVSHPNVIKLLGACIKGEPPMIIIEYCCFGSLRSYLRLSRKLEESGDLNIDGVEPVTATDVLSFAWQICKGMAYLTEMKLVHRDLAARNVLLAEGKICKVSDFGLTRDVYEDDAYLKKSKDRVPVKWMSPESLADHVYTTKTDVWSFGIVGYELITLGATPYPGIPPQNLYHLLRSGYRMERPDNCSTEIYTLLEACWVDDPSKRPSFKYLASKFEKLLGRSAKYLDIDIDDGAISNPMYLANVDEISNFESSSAGDKIDKINDDIEEESNRLNELWSTPKFKTDVSKVDNKKYLLKYDDQLQLLLARYDQPKPLAEARSISQKLRYQNDLHTFMPPNSYVNTSQPDLLSASDRERLIETRYDTPKLKRNRSYVEMRNIARCRKSSQSTTTDSFDDNNNEMPCNRATINENLNFNDLDKLLNTDKEISFQFSSLNNLNQRLTMNETKC